MFKVRTLIIQNIFKQLKVGDAFRWMKTTNLTRVDSFDWFNADTDSCLVVCKLRGWLSISSQLA